MRYQRQLTKRTFTKVLFDHHKHAKVTPTTDGDEVFKITRLISRSLQHFPGRMSCFSPFLLPGAKIGTFSLDNLVNRKTNTSLLEARNPKRKHVTLDLRRLLAKRERAVMMDYNTDKNNCGNLSLQLADSRSVLDRDVPACFEKLVYSYFDWIRCSMFRSIDFFFQRCSTGLGQTLKLDYITHCHTVIILGHCCAIQFFQLAYVYRSTFQYLARFEFCQRL